MVRFVLLLILFNLASLCGAQVVLEEGKVLYDITYDSLAPSLKSNMGYLAKDAAMYFKGKKSRAEMGVGPFGKNVTINDQEAKNMTILLNVFGKKMALVKTDSEMVAFKNMMAKDSLPTEVILTGESKKILGYTCKKALIKRYPKSQSPQTTEVWFTPQIRPFYVDPDPAFKKLDGLLMDFRINQDGNIVHIKAKLVLPAPIDDSLFVIPKDYQFVTESELTRIMNMLMMERQKGN
ncbi:MAG: DUF4412 domain-containing protein [Bacteroidia bacterium]